MQEVIEDYLGQVKIGRKQSHKNLAMFPLLSTYTVDLEYLLLDEALGDGLVEVVEVSEEGSVPELKVTNKSPKMVLILDGEELVGARQKRIVNTIILIQGNGTIVIPVSCVEQGRWSYHSPHFASEERVMSPSLRAMKSEQVQFSLAFARMPRAPVLRSSLPSAVALLRRPGCYCGSGPKKFFQHRGVAGIPEFLTRFIPGFYPV